MGHYQGLQSFEIVLKQFFLKFKIAQLGQALHLYRGKSPYVN